MSRVGFFVNLSSNPFSGSGNGVDYLMSKHFAASGFFRDQTCLDRILSAEDEKLFLFAFPKVIYPL
ncbi:hypothetical protein GFU50_09765 [Enterococcus casseliflavus]|uniref:Uncharacterized protein n=1 Tax=Enterococcus casseliflavus TaxID=37734 RepID=A0ABD6YZZ6_ENTCA|nr:hypothetical protein GFU50_09765 [Enterococcus casseliflavus]